MDVVRVALALFLFAPLAAATPVEIPAVKEFHETMMMNPDNRTAMVADGEVSKEEDVVPNASPNVADGVKTGIGFGMGIIIAFIIIAICLPLFCRLGQIFQITDPGIAVLPPLFGRPLINR